VTYDFEAHVLTEDSASEAQEVVETLLKKMFLFMDGRFQSHRVDFRPLGEARLKIATLPSLWNSSEAAHEAVLRDLGQYIATQLLRSEPVTFVFFHFDGDSKWSERLASGINAPRFESRVRTRIRNFVRGILSKRGEEDRLEQVMKRLRPLVPYYCVESWTYQNLDRARALCEQHCGEHADLLDKWGHDRASVDEVEQPWAALCLGKLHNLDLAGAGFPAGEAYGAGASYWAAVESLQECDQLLERIRATWDRDYSAG
tara:strand:+ start:1760 stop:2533 length:774 start_codon:yes stop_codon:yes gene_type:complete